MAGIEFLHSVNWTLLMCWSTHRLYPFPVPLDQRVSCWVLWECEKRTPLFDISPLLNILCHSSYLKKSNYMCLDCCCSQQICIPKFPAGWLLSPVLTFLFGRWSIFLLAKNSFLAIFYIMHVCLHMKLSLTFYTEYLNIF